MLDLHMNRCKKYNNSVNSYHLRNSQTREFLHHLSGGVVLDKFLAIRQSLCHLLLKHFHVRSCLFHLLS